jgi:DNA-binding NarL/FixJ family response regulator
LSPAFPTSDDAAALWAWAEHLVGATATAPVPTAAFALFGAATHEHRGVSMLPNDPEGAAAAFAAAASGHRVWTARLRATLGQARALAGAGVPLAADELRSRVVGRGARAWPRPFDWPAVAGAAGSSVVGAATSTPLGRDDPLVMLDPRQLEVLLAVADGLRSREIAARLGMAPGQVDRIIRTARSRLGARTRAEAAALVAAARR